jgi:hypothetical protein
MHFAGSVFGSSGTGCVAAKIGSVLAAKSSAHKIDFTALVTTCLQPYMVTLQYQCRAFH